MLVASVAVAQLRDFSGTIRSIDAGKVTVQGRADDVRTFARSSATRVGGKRGGWGELRQGDAVVVGWSMDDEPVVARRIHVVSTAASDR